MAPLSSGPQQLPESGLGEPGLSLAALTSGSVLEAHMFCAG